MKPKRIAGYICVTLIMGVIGFFLFWGLGALTNLTLYSVNGIALSIENILFGSPGAMLAPMGGVVFALSVYIENPIAVILNKYIQWEEEYKSSIQSK